MENKIKLIKTKDIIYYSLSFLVVFSILIIFFISHNSAIENHTASRVLFIEKNTSYVPHDFHYLYEVTLLRLLKLSKSTNLLYPIKILYLHTAFFISLFLILSFWSLRRISQNYFYIFIILSTLLAGSAIVIRNILRVEDNVGFYPFLFPFLILLPEKHQFKTNKWKSNLFLCALFYSLTVNFHSTPSCFLTIGLCLIYFGIKRNYSQISKILAIIAAAFTSNFIVFNFKSPSLIQIMHSLINMENPVGKFKLNLDNLLTKVSVSSQDHYSPLHEIAIVNLSTSEFSWTLNSNYIAIIWIVVIISSFITFIIDRENLFKKYSLMIFSCLLVTTLIFTILHEPGIWEKLDVLWFLIVAFLSIILLKTKFLIPKVLILGFFIMHITSGLYSFYNPSGTRKAYTEISKQIDFNKINADNYEIILLPVRYMFFQHSTYLHLLKYYGSIYYVGVDKHGKDIVVQGYSKYDIFLPDTWDQEFLKNKIYAIPKSLSNQRVYELKNFITTHKSENIYIHPDIKL